MDVDYGPLAQDQRHKTLRARVQKGDCVYSIFIVLRHSSAELVHSILDLHCAQSILPYRQHTFEHPPLKFGV